MYMALSRVSTVSVIAASLLAPKSIFAAHPLITEDTGTQGKGKFQLEHNIEQGYKDEEGADISSSTLSSTLSYGVTDRIDVAVTLPSVRNKSSREGFIATERGRYDNAYDVKWRFYESGPWSYALKGGATTPNGDEAKGLGTGRATYSAYLIITREEASWSWNMHIGLLANRNRQEDRDDLWHGSIGGWRQAGQKTKLVADAGCLTNSDPASSRCLGFLTLGIVYSPMEDFDIDLGIKKGLTRAEVDYAWLAGLTFRF